MCEVHTKQPELEALSTLIARVNGSLDLDEVLGHATDVCTALTGCAGALVYLWDEEQGRLVVRGASEGYRHWIGEFSLALGEGLTGWTALSRRPGIIGEDPLSDPRYKLVPELEDTRFQSVLTIPVAGQGDRLVGVLTLHTTAPHEFTDEDTRLMETVASLVAGAVENAQLHRRALRAVEVFRSLAELSQQLTSPARSRERLQRLALTALELLDATAVVVLRLDERGERLVIETWAGGTGRAARANAVRAEGPWSRLLGGGPVSLPVPPDDPFVGQLDLDAAPRSLFAAPLSFEGTPTGLLCCYASERRSLGDDNLALLGAIANHAAIALEEDRLRAAVDERARVRALFDALRSGEPTAGAERLGLRLADPHAVVVVEGGSSQADPGLASVGRSLDEVFRGSLVDARGGALAALVPVRSEAWERLLEELLGGALDELGQRAGTELNAGFSESTGRGGDYALAFRQASMACGIARVSKPTRRVCSFAALGAQRYLWAISQERDPDPLEVTVRRLIDVDRARGSELFRTLETYLENQGNARRTASALFVHRNTLRQRLRRIREVIGLDPTDAAVWFDLVLAVRLIRFRGGDGAA